ncbi:MAG: pentapeptide repeat-containing protein [Anaerolineae bacterium]|nr:pentapeptide repeat-containing protein [Gloeobacterales cyanobacterium ES-bin-313]
MQARELLKLYDQGRRDFRNLDLEYLIFRNMTLVEADFSSSNLRYANFSEADLANSDFTNTQIERTNFSSANLQNAAIDTRSLENAILSRTIMPNGSTNELASVKYLEKLLSHYKRLTWKPIFETFRSFKADLNSQNFSSDVAVSKIGGFPWLPKNSPWPLCKICGKPQTFIFQLRLGLLPLADIVDDKLVQIFFCDTCSTKPDEEFFLQSFDCNNTCGNEAIPPNPASLLVERLITGWQERSDYPKEFDLERNGFEFSEELKLFLMSKDVERIVEDSIYAIEHKHFPYLYDTYILETTMITDCHKSGGWPSLLQSYLPYPKCKICKKRCLSISVFRWLSRGLARQWQWISTPMSQAQRANFL